MIAITKQQRALLTLVCDGMLDEALALIGPNHPTAKWFQRETSWNLADPRKRYVMRQAHKLLCYYEPTTNTTLRLIR